jgi:Helicase conserved C-terminal domain
MSLFDPNILAAATAPPAPMSDRTSNLIHRAMRDDATPEQIRLASEALAAENVNVIGMVRPFLAHQAAAYDYATRALVRHGYVLIGDAPGLGKTQVAFALVADRLREHGGYAIMVAPPVAKGGYMSDLAASFPHLRFHHCYGTKPDFANLPEADIYFLSDHTQSMKAWLVMTEKQQRGGKLEDVFVPNAFARGASMLVRDEIHRDKGIDGNPGKGRGAVLLAVATALRETGAPRVALTGTIATNRPVELFVPLQILAGGYEALRTVTPGSTSERGFLWRYCNPQKIWNGRKTVTDFSGCDRENILRLNPLMRENWYVRREASSLVDAEGNSLLPHQGVIVVPFALNGKMARYERLEKEFLQVILEEKGRLAAERAARAKQINQLTALYIEAGVAKAPATVEYVKDLVDQGRPVIVFYVHTEVRDRIAQGLDGVKIPHVTISGKTTGQARIDAIARFQNGGAMVCIAQFKAAGMSVTLTAAADAVMAQMPWSAGDYSQAAGRNLRVDAITMARAQAGEKVTIHVLQSCYANGDPTFDAAIFGVVERKVQVTDAVNIGREVTMPEGSVIELAIAAWYPAAQAHHNMREGG